MSIKQTAFSVDYDGEGFIFTTHDNKYMLKSL